MEVVSKLYTTMGINQMLFDLNLSFLGEIRKTNNYDALLSAKTKRIILSFTDHEIETISMAAFSMVVLDNNKFIKAVNSNFIPKEINSQVNLKAEVLFAIQRMSANSASMEYAFLVNLENHQTFLTMPLSEIKKASKSKHNFLYLRKGFNHRRWECLKKIIQHQHDDKTEDEIAKEIMLCLM